MKTWHCPIGLYCILSKLFCFRQKWTEVGTMSYKDATGIHRFIKLELK